MELYSLVGKSGTGKSFQANELCDEFGIHSIIDDGLFIVDGNILAGISAKRQPTKIRAIKTALFNDEMHHNSVCEAIKHANPESILLIGTSDKMIGLICKRLSLPAPIIRFDIEDLTTESEREAAQKQRVELGQHVIPAPTFQIRKDFSGYFMHPLRAIKDITQDFRGGLKPPRSSRGKAPANHETTARFAERTIVRPTYSYLGKYSISDTAIGDIIILAAQEYGSVDSVDYVHVKNQEGGASVKMGVAVRRGFPALDIARKVQLMIASKLEELTSINILAVDVEILGMAWEQA